MGWKNSRSPSRKCCILSVIRNQIQQVWQHICLFTLRSVKKNTLFSWIMMTLDRWWVFCLTSINAKTAAGSEYGGIFIWRVHHYFFKASISFHLPGMRILWNAWMTCCLFFPRPLNGDSSVPRDALRHTRDRVTLIQHRIRQQWRKKSINKEPRLHPRACELSASIWRTYWCPCVGLVLLIYRIEGRLTWTVEGSRPTRNAF